jgi:hypothetical protein
VGEEWRRITIGRYPVVSLAQARDKTKTIIAKHQLDLDHGLTRSSARPASNSSPVELARYPRFAAREGEALGHCWIPAGSSTDPLLVGFEDIGLEFQICLFPYIMSAAAAGSSRRLSSKECV